MAFYDDAIERGKQDGVRGGDRCGFGAGLGSSLGSVGSGEARSRTSPLRLRGRQCCDCLIELLRRG